MTDQPGPDAPRPLRVLVVDDDPRVRAAMTAELTAARCRPTTTAPNDLASPPAESRSPRPSTGIDVALVDVALPTPASGLALIEQLSATLPVVAFSINGASRDAAIAAGATAYLEKDGDTDRLLHALQTATEPTDARSSQ